MFRSARSPLLSSLAVGLVVGLVAPAAAEVPSADQMQPASDTAIDPFGTETSYAEELEADEVPADLSTGLRTSTSVSTQAVPTLVKPPSDPAPLRVQGGGWGHGVGMSQYGAQEMARQGHTYRQILAHYHRGTSTQVRTMPSAFRVGLRSGPGTSHGTLHHQRMTVTAVDGPITWSVCTTTTGGCTKLRDQPVGTTYVAGHASGRLILREGSISPYYYDSSDATFLRAQLGTGSTAKRVRVAEKNGRTYRWGALEVRKPLSGHSGVRATVDLSGQFERYLDGLAEVPFSWHQHALRAQVVAARSYAVARSQALRTDCTCVLTDGPENQVYHGADLELGGGGDAWRQAVTATAGEVVTHDGAPVITFYSSSHNKRSENVQDVFTATQPYHRSVSDPYSGASANPYRTWIVAPSNASLATRISGMSVVTYVRVLERTDGGTPTLLGVEGRDSSGNKVVRQVASGSSSSNIGRDMKVWFGLRSAQIDSLGFSTFTDVSAHRTRAHVHDIAQIQRVGLTEGCTTTTTYCPDRVLNRAEMAAFLWRMANKPRPSSRHSFPDVPRGSYYDDAVSWLVQEGITDGYGNTGRYEPKLPVTRGQMAAFLWRLAGEPAQGGAQPFSDVDTRRYYNEPIKWLAAKGITEGYGDGTYRPNDELNRAQMASFAVRFLEVMR